MIKVDVRQANRELEKLKKQVSSKQVASATKMALNDGVRKGKTEVKKSISSLYNISSSRIDDGNKKKGLSLKLATNDHLMAEVDAGHIPVNLSEASAKFKGETVATKVSFRGGKAKKGKAIKRSLGKISVEVIKGERKELETAFTIGRATHAATGQQFTTTAIFARGKKGKPDFKFGKSRLPIDSMSTVSVATAALNTDAQTKVQPIVNQHVTNRMIHHLKRAIK
jgi:hypothetical protein